MQASDIGVQCLVGDAGVAERECPRCTASSALPESGYGDGIQLVPEGYNGVAVIQHDPGGEALLRGVLKFVKPFEAVG
jgi:hypothetical protein